MDAGKIMTVVGVVSIGLVLVAAYSIVRVGSQSSIGGKIPNDFCNDHGYRDDINGESSDNEG